MSEKKEPLSEETSRRPEVLGGVSPVRDRGRWGRPSGSKLRRTAARIRSGAILIRDPELPPSEIADVLEELVHEELLESVKIETLEFERMCRELQEQGRVARERSLVAALLRLKKSPEASDPESAVAQTVRQLNRQRRNELGRPRKRKKKG